MNILGIDASLNSPGFVILNLNESLETFKYFLCGTVRKYAEYDEYVYMNTNYKNKHSKTLSKQSIIKQTLKSIVKRFDIRYAGIEGYSYMSFGSGVYQLGETAGAVKLVLFENNIPFKIYEPSLIKKLVCGKGNAKKDIIKQSLLTNFSFLKEFEKYNAAQYDLYDAFGVALLLYYNLQIYLKRIELKHLPISIQTILTHKFPKKPETILEENFITRST